MKPIDISGPNGVTSRAASAAAAPMRSPVLGKAARPEAAAPDTPALSLASAGEAPPVDGERVAEIRKAIEDGRYPVIPTRIADAMIAAGLLLRTK